jgi:predicted transcriptional regulator
MSAAPADGRRSAPGLASAGSAPASVHVPRWRLAPESDLALRSFEDGCVVHHALTNATHRLTDTAGELLVALREHGPQSSAELAAPYGVEADEVEALLLQLDRLELVRRGD